MTSPLAVNSVYGAQQPRICSFPDAPSSAGGEAVDLCRMAGLNLDPWQAFVLERALGEMPDGRWACFGVGLVVPRQNGKDGLLEARSLAGLFLLGERLITHSAHQFDTSLEAFRRLLLLIENTPDLSRRVKRVAKSHGEEGIELMSGQRIRFRTRTKGGGRGFSGDCVFLNEAMILPEASMGALLPTLSARPNPQVWYTGSPVDQMIHEHGSVLARVRKRGLEGAERLGYAEWSADADLDEAHTVLDDPEAWAQANPALGIRITEEYIRAERDALDDRTFAVERLGIGDWPDPDGEDERDIDPREWTRLADPESVAVAPVVFCFDVSPDRSMSSIAIAGRRTDKLFHVEVIERHPGTRWVTDRIVELTKAHQTAAVVCDGSSPAASLVNAMKNEGVEVDEINSQEHAEACGVLVDAVTDRKMRHRDPTGSLGTAIRGAARRPLGEAWAWARKKSTTDITPLVAVTLALWKAEQVTESVYESRELMIF